MVRTFLRYRNYAGGVLFVSAIVYASYPQFNFVWVLLITVLVAIVIGLVMAKLSKSQQSSNRL